MLILAMLALTQAALTDDEVLWTAWSPFKEGATVTLKVELLNLKRTDTVTWTLKTKEAEKMTFEIVSEKPDGVERSEKSIEKPKAADGKEKETCGLCSKPHKEPKRKVTREKVRVGNDLPLDCTVEEVTWFWCDGKEGGVLKTWTHKSVPGGLVKGETSMGGVVAMRMTCVKVKP
jgi:hypothetical protein